MLSGVTVCMYSDVILLYGFCIVFLRVMYMW